MGGGVSIEPLFLSRSSRQSLSFGGPTVLCSSQLKERRLREVNGCAPPHTASRQRRRQSEPSPLPRCRAGPRGHIVVFPWEASTSWWEGEKRGTPARPRVSPCPSARAPGALTVGACPWLGLRGSAWIHPGIGIDIAVDGPWSLPARC